MPQTPILWSFRRCPYAMRARLAIRQSGVQVELREILLRDKPQAFLDTSAKGTVPVLNTHTSVIAESRDIMLWALTQNDPNDWLDMPIDGHNLMNRNDGPFKTALDHTKYAVRFPDRDTTQDRTEAAETLHDLNTRLSHHPWLTGPTQKLADAAIAPFIRQFANTDRAWFNAQDWPHLIKWLTTFETSDAFTTIMHKYTPWEPGIPFP